MTQDYEPQSMGHAPDSINDNLWHAVDEISDLEGINPQDYDRDNTWQQLNRHHGYGGDINDDVASEALLTFADRYIPDWRELDPEQIQDELDSVASQIHFDFYDLHDHPVTPEQVADELGHKDFNGIGQVVVRYYPSGTAAFVMKDGIPTSPRPVPNVPRGTNPLVPGRYDEPEAQDDHRYLEEHIALIRENGPDVVYPHREEYHTTTEEENEPTSDFMDRYVPDWRNLDPEILTMEVNDLKDKFNFRLWKNPAFNSSENVHLPGYVNRDGSANRPNGLYNRVEYYTSGTAAFLDISQAQIVFTPMDPLDEDAVAILLRTARTWEAEALAIKARTSDHQVAVRALFASNVAFIAAKNLQAGKCCVTAAVALTPSDLEIVGLCVYFIYPDHTALIDLMTVAPQFQPDNGSPKPQVRGIGTGLLCEVAGDMVNHGVRQVCLKPLDEAAKSFWGNRGFTLSPGSKLCVIDGVDRLATACMNNPDCPDQGHHCGIGDAVHIAHFTKPSLVAHFAI